jgi:hypothetical protein
MYIFSQASNNHELTTSAKDDSEVEEGRMFDAISHWYFVFGHEIAVSEVHRFARIIILTCRLCYLAQSR